MQINTKSAGFLKIIFLLSLTIFMFGGCFNFGGSTTPQVSTNDKMLVINNANYDFNITIPREWDIIEKKDYTKDVPAETVLVFRNNLKNEDYTASVVINQITFQNVRDSLEAAKYVLNKQKTSLYDYKEIRERELRKIKIGSQQFDTYIAYFQGREKTDSQLINFIQITASRGNSGYTVTGSLSTKENANNSKIVEDIVKSFSLK